MGTKRVYFMGRKLKEICEFIQADDKNSDIMDCYEEYLDQELDPNTLMEICQDRLEDAREDFMNGPEDKKAQFLKHTKLLGI